MIAGKYGNNPKRNNENGEAHFLNRQHQNQDTGKKDKADIISNRIEEGGKFGNVAG